VKFGIISVVNIKITISWDVTHCGLVAGCRYFHRTCCIHVECRIMKQHFLLKCWHPMNRWKMYM